MSSEKVHWSVKEEITEYTDGLLTAGDRLTGIDTLCQWTGILTDFDVY